MARAGTTATARAGTATGRPGPARAAARTAPARRPHRVTLPTPGLELLRSPRVRRLRARGGRMLDALLAGRGWIALVGLLLVGIVFFNIGVLQLNRKIARTTEQATEVKRDNARLRLELARLGSSERLQQVAAEEGFVLPAPGEVRYLTATPGLDGRRAAERIAEPAEVPAPAPVPSGAPPVEAAPVEVDPAMEAPVTPEPVAAEPEAPVVADPVVPVEATGAPTAPPG